VDELVEVGKKHGITTQEIAFRWLVHHSQLSRKYGDGIITASRNVERNKVALGIFCFFLFSCSCFCFYFYFYFFSRPFTLTSFILSFFDLFFSFSFSFSFLFSLPSFIILFLNIIFTVDQLEKGPLPEDVVKTVEAIWPKIKADAPAYHN
jgi:hypothetical protein